MAKAPTRSRLKPRQADDAQQGNSAGDRAEDQALALLLLLEVGACDIHVLRIATPMPAAQACRTPLIVKELPRQSRRAGQALSDNGQSCCRM